MDYIKERKLIIKPPYEKVINTIWQIYPNKNMEESYTLILYKKFNKNYLFFHSSFVNSKDILKEINLPESKEHFSQSKINISKHWPKEIKSEYFFEYIYEDNFLIDNISFFNGIETINKLDDKLFIFKNEILTKKLGKEFLKILIFFCEKDLDKIIIDLVKKKQLYLEHIFIIIINRRENNKTNSNCLNTSDELMQN